METSEEAMHQEQSSIPFNQQLPIAIMEGLENRRMMSATVFGSITIHSVLSSTPVFSFNPSAAKVSATRTKSRHAPPAPVSSPSPSRETGS
jgi:hypothetical protein